MVVRSAAGGVGHIACPSATGDAVKAIEDIGTMIGEISEISTTVASAVEEQRAATGEISRNVQQAAIGTQEVSSNITGVNDAAQETGAAAAQERHGEVVRLEETMQAGVLRARVLTTRPLDRYHHKGLISDTQWFAGDKFSRDWYTGCQGARVTGHYDVRIVGGVVNNERMVDARERVKYVLRDIGRQLRPVVVHVCGLDLSASAWAKMYGEPKRAGITVLRLALNALDDTYAGLKRFGTN